MEKPETSIHHTWYNRAWYRTPELRALRDHRLSKTSLYIPVHNDLHAELQPPPKPSPTLALGAVVLLDQMVERKQTDHITANLVLAEYFLSQDSNLSLRIGHHLIKQTAYMIEGVPCS